MPNTKQDAPAPMPANVRRYLESVRRRAAHKVAAAKRQHKPVDGMLESKLVTQLDELLAKHPPPRSEQN
jgi:hypothetical protein